LTGLSIFAFAIYSVFSVCSVLSVVKTSFFTSSSKFNKIKFYLQYFILLLQLSFGSITVLPISKDQKLMALQKNKFTKKQRQLFKIANFFSIFCVLCALCGKNLFFLQ